MHISSCNSSYVFTGYLHTSLRQVPPPPQSLPLISAFPIATHAQQNPYPQPSPTQPLFAKSPPPPQFLPLISAFPIATHAQQNPYPQPSPTQPLFAKSPPPAIPTSYLSLPNSNSRTAESIPTAQPHTTSLCQVSPPPRNSYLLSQPSQ